MRPRAKKKATIAKRDPKKESDFRTLSKLLTDSGYSVRREPLKRGIGWKVVSGSCRLKDDSLIFIDRQMAQEDQVAFLVSKIVSLELPIPSMVMEQLSKELQESLAGYAENLTSLAV